MPADRSPVALGMITFNSVLGAYQPRVFANDKATGQPRSSYVCTCNEGVFDHRLLAGQLRHHQHVLALNSVLGKDQPHGFVRGKATRRP